MKPAKLMHRETPLERGDLRVLILNALKEPMHGYQILCEFKKASGGSYEPSTGALYPQLRGLEEEGLVACEDEGGKKVYKVTRKGEEYLKQNKKLVKDTIDRFHEYMGNPEMREITELMHSMIATGSVGINEYFRGNDPKGEEKIRKTKELLKRMNRELDAIWTGGNA